RPRPPGPGGAAVPARPGRRCGGGRRAQRLDRGGAELVRRPARGGGGRRQHHRARTPRQRAGGPGAHHRLPGRLARRGPGRPRRRGRAAAAAALVTTEPTRPDRPGCAPPSAGWRARQPRAPRVAGMDSEERMAVFLDYENLALGAREHLGGMTFDFGPIADALAVRGRVVVRRAYADWSYFDEDRRSLTRHQVELIEMPQRMGASRKNAADIKMVVDAIEMAFERDYITTFVMCTGDSDFSPRMHKLRELSRRVLALGAEKATTWRLPPACDEFLFYARREGVEGPDETDPAPRRRRGQRQAGATGSESAAAAVGPVPPVQPAPAP